LVPQKGLTRRERREGVSPSRNPPGVGKEHFESFEPAGPPNRIYEKKNGEQQRTSNAPREQKKRGPRAPMSPGGEGDFHAGS